AQHRQLVERAHRRFEFIADAVDVQHQPRRRLVRQQAPQAADHRRLQARRVSIPMRCALARVWAWVTAMARAPAASACRRPLRPRIAPTMCCTWALSAAPLPTRASFTWRAPYSLTGRPCMTTAQIAAPRAWPSLSAESAFFDTKTCSIATSSGRWASMTARSPSSSLRSRSGRSPGAAAARASRSSGAWNTWVQRPAASTSMMPTPVRCEPGSMPRILVTGDSLRVRVVAELGVGIHGLHVVDVLEPGQQLDHLLRGLAFHRHVVVGAHRDLGMPRRDPGGGHGVAYRA